ncbi:MAG: hypothetical protein C0404_02170 [Verrucomicrobia bacterium]|nr:hypothetical protein [Verrucomicrobiota bacterium]
MGLKICVLSSGSSGNCTFIGGERTRILIDAGLSGKETAVRLERIGESIACVSAVCVTHEHDDHTAGVGVLHRRYKMKLYANTGTIESLEQAKKLDKLPWNVFATGSPFDIEELHIEPFSVPHDSFDPVGFAVSSGGSRVGVVTDMGMTTGLIREKLKNCQAVVLESNHDEDMLKDSVRPWSLKQRIFGRQGHLSNMQARELIGEIAGPNLKFIFLAHISSDCNRPHIAQRSAQQAVERAGHTTEVKLTYPDKPSDAVEV